MYPEPPQLIKCAPKTAPIYAECFYNLTLLIKSFHQRNILESAVMGNKKMP